MTKDVERLLFVVLLLALLGCGEQLTVRPPVRKGSTCGDAAPGTTSDDANDPEFNFKTSVFGTFLTTCSICSLSGDVDTIGTTLTCARCSNPNGSKSQTSILVSTCPSRVFKNVQGILECDANFPQGDFLESCTQCTVTGTLLECHCAGYASGIRTSIIMASCSRFSNVNGKLACTPGFEDLE